MEAWPYGQRTETVTMANPYYSCKFLVLPSPYVSICSYNEQLDHIPSSSRIIL